MGLDSRLPGSQPRRQGPSPVGPARPTSRGQSGDRLAPPRPPHQLAAAAASSPASLRVLGNGRSVPTGGPAALLSPPHPNPASRGRRPDSPPQAAAHRPEPPSSPSARPQPPPAGSEERGPHLSSQSLHFTCSGTSCWNRTWLMLDRGPPLRAAATGSGPRTRLSGVRALLRFEFGARLPLRGRSREIGGS